MRTTICGIFLSIILVACGSDSSDNSDDTTSTSTTVTYSANVSALMSANCTSCHSGSSPQGNLDLSTFENVKNSAESGTLLTRISSTSNPMPPSGLMSESNQSIMTNWRDGGYQE